MQLCENLRWQDISVRIHEGDKYYLTAFVLFYFYFFYLKPYECKILKQDVNFPTADFVKNVSSILVDFKPHYMQMHFKTVGPWNTECIILLAVPSTGEDPAE